MTRLMIGTRGSALATRQAGMVAEMLRAHGHDAVLEIIETRGDRELDRTVPELGGKGLFTAELEAALADGRVHLAVHSLKDLPTADTEGLVVAAIPDREDPRDVLVSRDGSRLEKLAQGARVGTASLRRRALLLAARPDLEVVPLRGNVDTRIGKVAEGEVAAVVLAAAGLHRLGRHDVITEYLEFLPAPAQGALAVQALAENDDIVDAVSEIHDDATAVCVRAERMLLHTLEGGCSVPVGAYAEPHEDGIHLRAVVASLDGAELVEAEYIADDPDELGRAVAESLLASGAREILDAIR